MCWFWKHQFLGHYTWVCTLHHFLELLMFPRCGCNTQISPSPLWPLSPTFLQKHLSAVGKQASSIKDKGKMLKFALFFFLISNFQWNWRKCNSQNRRRLPEKYGSMFSSWRKSQSFLIRPSCLFPTLQGGGHQSLYGHVSLAVKKLIYLI